MKNIFVNYKNQLGGIVITFIVTTFVFAAPPLSPYNPNETLDPACAPGDINCIVQLPNGADNLGNHTMTGNLLTNGNWIGNDGDNEGIFVDSIGRIGINSSTPTSFANFPSIAIGAGTGGALYDIIDGTTRMSSFGWNRSINQLQLFNLSSTGTVSIKTGGLGSGLFIDASNNVGIGTTTPSAKFNVESGQTLLNNSSGNSLTSNGFSFFQRAGQPVGIRETTNSLSTLGAIGFERGDGSGNDMYISTVGDGANGIGAIVVGALTNTLAVTYSGSVGIGTTTPVRKLDVNGSSRITGDSSSTALQLQPAANTWGMTIDATSTASQSFGLRINAGTNSGDTPLQIKNALQNKDLFTVLGNGDTGIGISSPAAKLHVEEGNIYIHRTSIENTNAVLDVHTDVTTASAGIYLRNNSRNWSTFVRSDTSHNYAIADETAGFVRFSISNTGGIRFWSYGAGTLTTDASGNITASSDERLKDIKSNYTRGLKDILKVSPITYKWNTLSGLDQTREYSGFSAQDMQKAIPEAVDTDDRGYLSLSDRPIIATIVNAIKELYKKFLSNEDDIATLKKIIELQQKQIEVQQDQIDDLKNKIK